MKNIGSQYDIAVIGGGPAGMMAAGKAAEMGAKVALIEKNNQLGKKLLITGKGRCNITQAEFDDREFTKKIGEDGRFMFSSLASFGPAEVIDFFEKRGLRTKTEQGGRVFPVSDQADEVLQILRSYLQENKVTVLLRREIKNIEIKNGSIKSITVVNPRTDGHSEKLSAKAYIICTGGKSYPGTGSTGDGYAWAKSAGHTIIPPRPALVPVNVKEGWIKELQGLSLKNVQLNIYQNNKKQASRFGEMLLTHFGLSGPIVLDISKAIGGLLSNGSVTAEIDLKPALDFVQLDKRLQRDFEKYHNKNFINYLPELVPQKMIGALMSLFGIDASRKVGSINREERRNLAVLLKGLRFEIKSLCGFGHAIVTTGGVKLQEVDSKTMKSRIVKNLFFAGEILDLDGPTGGFNLQICWSTGRAAGTHAAQFITV